MQVLEENLFGDFHAAMTLRILILVSLGVCWYIWRLVSFVQLFKNKVVSSIILANDDQAAALFIVANVNLTRRQTGGRGGDTIETLILALES